MIRNKGLKALILIIILSLSFSTMTFAKTDKNNKNKNYYKKYTKRFKDVEENHWANSFIEKMGAKNLIFGDGKGNYLPLKATSKMEVLTMTIRIMGWEDEAKGYTSLPDGYDGANIPEWAIGYLNVAYEKGIIKAEEFKTFNPNAAAKRYEVAKYIIRAIGYEAEAIANMNTALSFKDVNAIPANHIGYVYMISKLELMVGYGGKFHPNASLTRAEMAVLFSRLDDKIENELNTSIIGEFLQVVEGQIGIEQEGKINYYTLSDNVLILNKDKEMISVEDLNLGDEIKIEIVEDRVVYVQVIDVEEEKILTIYKGKVVNITEDLLSIKTRNMELSFEIDEETKFVYDGEEIDLEDMHINDIVLVTIDQKEVLKKVEVIEPAEVEEILTHYKGKVVTTTDDVISIKMENIVLSFEIEDDTEFVYDGETIEYEDIQINDIVIITINQDEELKKVEVKEQAEIPEEILTLYMGKVVSKTEDVISIGIENVTLSFEINDDTEFVYDGETIEYEDIQINDIVIITINQDEVLKKVEIKEQAETPEEILTLYKGKVISKTEDVISIGIENVTLSFEINDDAEYVFDGETIEYEDIQINDIVIITINQDEVLKKVEVKEQAEVNTLAFYKGEVIDIIEDIISIRMNTMELSFKVDDDTKFVFDEEVIEFEDVHLNDIVVITVDQDERVKQVEVKEYAENDDDDEEDDSESENDD